MPTPSPREPVIVHVFGRTDVGRTREHNEDAFVVADLTRANATLQPEVRTHEVGDRGSLFMVADGMGGAAAGEIASAMAIDVILREVTDAVSRAGGPSEEIFATAIKRATAAANSHIHTFALEHPEYRGMGTTATVAGVLGDTLYLAQVGDSRAYLIRNGVGQQITKDQSLMQKLIEAGELTEEEAEQSERRNIILQALGPEATIKVDLTHQRVRRGDVLVLCSDGLSGQVRGDEIARIVSEEKDLMAACKRMIDRANENGGPDNITVIVARFDGAGLTDPDTTDDVGHRIFPLATDSGPVDTVPRDATTRTTAEMPSVRRPTLELPVDAFLIPPPNTESAAKRRVRGSMIALALLIVFFAGVIWYVYRVGSAVVAPRHGGTPTPTDTRP
ncbi:MAG: Stp1/IreP family PP2C-type Ser/Thr phosphatase [Gemmatimonadota bacterium]|nr:Stp1/IreP family PP2C-type Ser/Thr phosphatase [Gemmatimonadota bacterium]